MPAGHCPSTVRPGHIKTTGGLTKVQPSGYFLLMTSHHSGYLLDFLGRSSHPTPPTNRINPSTTALIPNAIGHADASGAPGWLPTRLDAVGKAKTESSGDTGDCSACSFPDGSKTAVNRTETAAHPNSPISGRTRSGTTILKQRYNISYPFLAPQLPQKRAPGASSLPQDTQNRLPVASGILAPQLPQNLTPDGF